MPGNINESFWAGSPLNFPERLDELERRLADMEANGATPQNVTPVSDSEPTYAAFSGWLLTGSSIRDVDGNIVLDASEPSIAVGNNIMIDKDGVHGYDDDAVQRFELNVDGSGWLGDSSIFSWTNAGVVTLNGSAVMPGTIEGSKTDFWNVPTLDSSTWSSNTPTSGYVTWPETVVTYRGTSYTVATGNTNKKYIYWDRNDAPTTFHGSDTIPAMANARFLVAINDSGVPRHTIFANFIYADYISVTNLAAISASMGDLTIDGVLTIGASGGLYQGTGTFASPTTGLKLWNDSGVGRLAGYYGGNVQVYFGTDGKLYAGAGNVIVDANGITLEPTTSSVVQLHMKHSEDAGDIGALWALRSSSGAQYDTVYLTRRRRDGTVVNQFAVGETVFEFQFGTGPYYDFCEDYMRIPADTQFYGNLIAERTYDAVTTGYQGYIFCPLNTPAVSASWAGGAHSTTSATELDLATVFGIPHGCQAVLAQISARDSAAWGAGGLEVDLGPSATYVYSLIARPAGGDIWTDEQGIVPCVNGKIYYQLAASGTNTLDIYIRIWGYFI